MQALRTYLQSYQERNSIPGLAVGIGHNGKTIFAEGFGHRNVAESLPVTAQTVFGVASVTKSFTALGIMLVQDDGKLSVTDPVTKWLPELRINGAAPTGMTIHHFLTHTSGLPGLQAMYHARALSIRQDPDFVVQPGGIDPFAVEPIRTYEDLMRLMADMKIELLGAPGEAFNYCNECWALLQGIIERASGQSYIDFMQARILDPAGMETATFLRSDLPKLPEVTELYSYTTVDGKRTYKHSPAWWDSADIYGQGALKASITDLLKYLEIYRTYGKPGSVRIASEAAIRQMMSPQVTMPTGKRYGYGLEVVPDHRGVKLAGHGGSIKGVSAHIMVAPEAGFTATALLNIQNAPAQEAALAAMNGALGLPLDAWTYTYPAYELAPERLAEYAGTYKSNEGLPMKVVLKDGALALESAGQAMPLRPYAEDGFATANGQAAVRFLRDENGQVKALFSGVRHIPRVK